MGYVPQLIAPWKSGLETYYKPFLIGDDAFQTMTNAYTYRGIVRKREGYDLLGTLPTVPVQELATYLFPNSLNEDLIAISRTNAYRFNNTTGLFDDISFYQTTGAAITWTGLATDFFISANYCNSLWTTNNVDPVRFYNGSFVQGWNNQRFQTNATPNYVLRAKFVIPYKGRLVLLNTEEGPLGGGIRHSQRARFSQVGTPYMTATGGDPVVVPPAPFATDVNAWRDDIIGRGGYIDADTSEEIVSAVIVSDTLIVFMERSTWRLRYTGNSILPFIWERISTQYGSESPRSTIQQESQCYTYSRWGWIGANTNGADKVDWPIIDLSFQVETGLVGEVLETVCAIRDVRKQFIYWAYPDATVGGLTSPNRVLAFNWIDNSWSTFDLPFRCFGTYKGFMDATWASMTASWASYGNAWGFNDFANLPVIVAGDTAGNVYIPFEPLSSGDDDGVNFGFEVTTKRFNPYISKGRKCRLEYVDIYCTQTPGGEFTLDLYINDNDSTPAMSRVVSTDLINQTAKYTRVFLGEVANFHQIKLYQTPAQIADPVKGKTLIQIQGMVIWTRPEGIIKDL